MRERLTVQQWWIDRSLAGAVMLDGYAGWSPLTGPAAKGILELSAVINVVPGVPVNIYPTVSIRR